MKTQVCITVDTEFDIAGAFADPARCRPVAQQSVLCEIDGRSHGLGFMLETLAAHGIAATFFVEALNSLYFGDEPMRVIAHRLLQAGHDVQLHLHPCWTYFRDPAWRDRLASMPPNDSVAGRSEEEVQALIAAGLAAFARWEVPRPVALRTGGLHVDLTVYAAMHRQGLPVASNVGLAIYRPASQALHLYSGRHRINGVLELPVLTYLRFQFAGWSNEKTLTVTGTSWAEMESLLWAAHRAQASPVVILTHPHEYVKFMPADPSSRALRPNRINQRRLSQLCAFLERHRDSFEVVTFARQASEWLQSGDSGNSRLDVSLFHAMRGMAENKLNDLIASY